jgi:ADP-heptose:LPS heptosyltransferase
MYLHGPEDKSGEVLSSRERGGPPGQLRRILIIRNGALGDFILTLPVIDSLRKAFPSAQVVVMGSPAVLQLAQDRIGEIIPTDLPGVYRLYQEQGHIPESIREKLGSFDLVLSYSPDPDRIFTHNLQRIGNSWIIDGSLPASIKPEVAVTDLLLLPLRKEGLAVSLDPPEITPSPADRTFAQDFLGKLLPQGKRSPVLVALHPGSGSLRKCWAIDSFAHIARWVSEVFGATVLLISGPADRQVTKSLVPLITDCNPVLIEQFSLTHVAAILERCTLYLGNDSGITHMAAAIGIPTIALFGPTDSRVWAPRNKNVAVLQSSFPCAPCSSQQMSDCAHPACMRGIGLASVKEVIYEFFRGVFLSCSGNHTAHRLGRESYHV